MENTEVKLERRGQKRCRYGVNKKTGACLRSKRSKR